MKCVFVSSLVLILAGCATPPPEAAAPAAKSHDYMAELREAEGEVAAIADDASKTRSAWQRLAVEQSFVGDTERALESFRASGLRASAKSPAEAVADPEVRGALDAIVEAVRDRQIVMINEGHHVPRDRAFATLVALELRKIGFRYLAVETLNETKTDALAARGYPLVWDGYYSRDPVFGDFIRRAMAVGYVPVAYEYSTSEVSDPKQRLARREEGQAVNLAERILAKDPAARILVHVGYGHLRKAVEDGIGIPKMMAEYLREKTGIDPYCIDQTQPLPADAVLARTLIEAAPADAFVVTPRGAGRRYLASSAVDMFVFHKPARIVKGRPDWLAMQGYRRPRAVPAYLLPVSGRRLVQAFGAAESADAVPVDQVIVTSGEPVPVFMLPKGKFRFAYQD